MNEKRKPRTWAEVHREVPSPKRPSAEETRKALRKILENFEPKGDAE